VWKKAIKQREKEKFNVVLVRVFPHTRKELGLHYCCSKSAIFVKEKKSQRQQGHLLKLERLRHKRRKKRSRVILEYTIEGLYSCQKKCRRKKDKVLEGGGRSAIRRSNLERA